MNIHKAREHIALHHQGADGWIALIRKESGRFAGQKHFRPEEISAVLSEWIGENVYFSQNTFYRPQRRVENVRQLRAVYVDVDHYLLNYSPEWVIGKMETELFGERVPDPNLIIHSGRGFVVVWLLEPVPGKKALPLWQAVEDHFSRQFRELGGDPKATDAARVFRLAGSVNSKSGAEVTVQYRHDHRYELRQLQADYLPELSPSLGKKGRPAKTVRIHQTRTLHYDRLRDLARLVEMRGGRVTGYRETICFLYRYWSCCVLNDEAEALRAALELNQEFAEPLREQEVITATKSAEKAWRAKNDIEANRIAREKGYPGAGYNLKNETIIQWLQITKEEQMELQTIIGSTEKLRRKTIANREVRRAAGMVSRGEYLEQEREKTEDRLWLLRKALKTHPKATQAELARLLGITQARISQLLKKI